MTNISEIAKNLSEKITNAETRQRSRTAEEYQRFLYAIEYILTDIWFEEGGRFYRGWWQNVPSE